MIKLFFRQLANLKFAIGLLLFIALISSIGSIIEQDKDLFFYQENYSNKIFGLYCWKFILLTGFNTIYTNWWFLMLFFLLAVSLICCTFLQQLPTLKFSKRYYFYKQVNQFNKLPFLLKGYKVFQSHLGHNLVKSEYSIFRQYNSIYAYKGLISRIGPIVVHISIICILMGTTLDALKGFNSQEIIPKTELFHTQNIIKHGFFSFIPQKTFRVNDFWSTYILNGLPRQFYSDISILNGNGIELERKTISVNNPLITNNILLYQTDWGILGLRIKIAKNEKSSYIFQLPVSRVQNKSSQKIWISWLPHKINIKNNNIIIVNNIRGQIELYNKNGKFITNVNLGEKILWNSLSNFQFIEFIPSTGIQIKSDPGIKLTYFGFFILIISSIISYISFSEFWLLSLTKEHVISGGKTNRAKIKYNLEFTKFRQSVLK